MILTCAPPNERVPTLWNINGRTREGTSRLQFTPSSTGRYSFQCWRSWSEPSPPLKLSISDGEGQGAWHPWVLGRGRGARLRGLCHLSSNRGGGGGTLCALGRTPGTWGASLCAPVSPQCTLGAFPCTPVHPQCTLGASLCTSASPCTPVRPQRTLGASPVHTGCIPMHTGCLSVHTGRIPLHQCIPSTYWAHPCAHQSVPVHPPHPLGASQCTPGTSPAHTGRTPVHPSARPCPLCAPV